MKTKNHLKAWMILGVYLTATCILLLLGYSVKKPAVKRQEFPFTITYSYQGKTETISDVYVAEYVRDAKYIGDDSLLWSGHIKDHDMRTYDYYTIADLEGQLFSINLNMTPGYLMGDPRYADYTCEPTAQYNGFDGVDEIVITDPAELAQMGFSMMSWTYPEPIENMFSFGGISLSSEASAYTAALAVLALLAGMILIRKDPELKYGRLDKVSIVLSFAVAIYAFPFILIVSMLSEIVADASIGQQILYLTPALTALGLSASITLRRLGKKVAGFYIQFAGPAIFALFVLFGSI